MAAKTILLCAGGTGGHLFPAEALAHELIKRGYTIHLAADKRIHRFAKNFPGKEIHEIRSATFGARNPVAVLRSAWELFAGYRESHALLKKLNPVAVAGFGGYPTVPPLLAASRVGIPTLVHEANAVLGRSNRFLAKHVSKVAIGFDSIKKLSGQEMLVTGNPVRPDILKAAKKSYPARQKNGPFHLLVFGGSQGASYFGEVLPQACALLPAGERKHLHIVQQARQDDLDRVIASYSRLGIRARVETFFDDMASQIARAHLVVSRAGASTVSELSVAGRPAILVPYPHALDHDQANNAASVAASGGAQIFHQSDLSPELLAKELAAAISNPKKLATAAKNAKKAGIPNATENLADALEQLIGEHRMK